jgi:hypothetical protein
MLGSDFGLKNLRRIPEAPKSYDFPVESASEASMRLVFEVSGHTLSSQLMR